MAVILNATHPALAYHFVGEYVANDVIDVRKLTQKTTMLMLSQRVVEAENTAISFTNSCATITFLFHLQP